MSGPAAEDGAALRQRIAALEEENRRLAQRLEDEQAGRTRAERNLRRDFVAQTGGAGLFRPVGHMSSCFPTRFGTPRQGLLADLSRGTVKIDSSVVGIKSLSGLEAFSHVWLLFVFHDNTDAHKRIPLSEQQGQAEAAEEASAEAGPAQAAGGAGAGAACAGAGATAWRAKAAKQKKQAAAEQSIFPSFIKPPMGGGIRVGLFATRSPHRPNPIGLTLARIDSIDLAKGLLHLRGVDLIDKTPILDIKPYVPHVDCPPTDSCVDLAAWVKNPRFDSAEVQFSPPALAELERLCGAGLCKWFGPGETAQLVKAIEQVIALDPRSVIHGRGVFNTDGIETPEQAAEQARRAALEAAEATATAAAPAQRVIGGTIGTSGAGSSSKASAADGKRVRGAPKAHLIRDSFVLDFDTFRVRFAPHAESRCIKVTAIEPHAESRCIKVTAIEPHKAAKPERRGDLDGAQSVAGAAEAAAEAAAFDEFDDDDADAPDAKVIAQRQRHVQKQTNVERIE
jgi:tRNA (Thr-GGU) A37 N-methylase